MDKHSLYLAIHHVQLRTQKLEETIRFYTEILGFELLGRWECVPYQLADLKKGTMILELGTGFPAYSDGDGFFNHICLATTDIQAAYEHLRTENVCLLTPSPLEGDRSRCHFRYLLFRGPNGEKLELVQEEAG